MGDEQLRNALAKTWGRGLTANHFFTGCSGYEAIELTARAILQPGDEIQMKLRNDRYELIDLQGRLVGRLAKAFRPPNSMILVCAQVIAIEERYRDEGKPEHHSKIKCDKWEGILPELVYEADNGN